MKSIECRIHAAIRGGKGIRIPADELWRFVNGDDALSTRICNAAANEAGHEEYGETVEGMFDMTWRQLGTISVPLDQKGAS